MPERYVSAIDERLCYCFKEVCFIFVNGGARTRSVFTIGAALNYYTDRIFQEKLP